MKQYSTIEEVLSDFVRAIHDSQRNWEIDFDRYGQACTEALKRLYLGNEDTPHIRLSAIGKPAVLQLLPVLGYSDKGPLDAGLRDIFYLGCEWEERTLAKLEVFHPQVRLERQVEVDFLGVKGHLDCIIHVEGVGSAVLELKTMHSFGCSNVDKYGMDDSKGYLTQLAVYCTALNLPGYWLVYDKGKADTSIYALDLEAPETVTALARARNIIPKMLEVHTLHDLFTKFRPPSPEQWTVKAGTFWTVPDSMKYCPHLNDIYMMQPFKGSTKPAVIKVFDRDDIIKNIEAKYLT